MFITKKELKEIDIKQTLLNNNFIKITDGKHSIYNVNGYAKVTHHDSLSTLPANKVPKYIKKELEKIN